MTTPQTHGLTISHTPLDGPGLRIAGNAKGDVNLYALRDVISGIEDDLKLTEASLSVPELHDLAQAVRDALSAIQAIGFHLLEVHNSVHEGNLNYTETPQSIYEDL